MPLLPVEPRPEKPSGIFPVPRVLSGAERIAAKQRDMDGMDLAKRGLARRRSNMRNRSRLLVICLAIAVFMAFVPVLCAQEGKININKASVDELTQLKNIGQTYAERIVQYREQNGPFEKPEDIMKVKGIGAKTWDLNKERIVVASED
jgi:competence protein ComEA